WGACTAIAIRCATKSALVWFPVRQPDCAGTVSLSLIGGVTGTRAFFIGIACASCPKAGHCGPSRPESASGVPRRACLSGKVRGPGNFPNYLRSIARLMLRASSAGAICASSQPGNGATVTLDGPRQPLDLLPERL